MSSEGANESNASENDALDQWTPVAGKRKENGAADSSSSSSKRRKSSDTALDSSGTDNLEQNIVKVKTEPSDSASSSHLTPVVGVKTEPVEVNIKTEPHEDETAHSSVSSCSQRSADNAGVTIKTEPTESGPQSCSSSAVKLESVDAGNSGGATRTASATATKTNDNAQSTSDACVSSSTIRPSCRFGIRCYRSNPMHRITEAHPGDADYRRPSFPAPPLGTPPCPFANNCYRRNPVHFQQFSHPPDFNSAQNIRSRLRQRRAVKQNSNNAATNSDSEADEDEPFSGDSDLEYTPGADVDDDDEDDELEFDSQRVNTDEYD